MDNVENGFMGWNINFLSDSQAALTALDSF
jgi:hypothetical protein